MTQLTYQGEPRVTYHWSYEPGTFLDRTTGTKIPFCKALPAGPNFMGTQEEWNETLVETLYDVISALNVPAGSSVDVYVSSRLLSIIETSACFVHDYLMKQRLHRVGNLRLHNETTARVFLDEGDPETIHIDFNGQHGFVRVTDLECSQRS